MVDDVRTAGNEDSPGEDGQLLVGFDFGTSWTAVMTNRGHKELIRSVVGYPKDMIGIKLLGAPYVLGAKAYEMRSYVDLRSPLQDGVLREYVERDLEAARHFVGHVIDSLGVRQGEEVCVIVGAPARASNTNKELLKKVFEEFVDTVQVISEPFLVAYGRGTLVKSIVVDIGAGTVDICVLKGAMPGQKSQITVNKAGNFVDEQLEALIVETYPDVQINVHMARAIKEQHGFVGSPEQQVLAELRANGRPVTYDVTDAVRNACETLMPSIIEGIDKLVQSAPPEDQASILKNIVISGGGSKIVGIGPYIAGKLKGFGNVAVSCVPDPEFAVAAGAMKLASELPPKYWEQLGSITDY